MCVFFFSFLLASLRKLDEQPEWLRGGKLRDYQLEGLNFLVNRYDYLLLEGKIVD
jgi:SNF2 family DNA or RNA helicase